MITINYTITFFSEWHTGSGLTSGSDLSTLVIKDKYKLPFIPGRTLKGLLREAAEELAELGKCTPEFIVQVFGLPPEKKKEKSNDYEDNKPSEKGKCFFSNASISDDIAKVVKNKGLTQFFYRSVASTAIEENGIAKKHSLRTMETSIPCTLYAEIVEVPEEFKEQIENCFKWIKRLGQTVIAG
jgi:CRISPR/Cas system CSM-associated protein Csm3 (group 7 of RAMP superfamily)